MVGQNPINPAFCVTKSETCTVYLLNDGNRRGSHHRQGIRYWMSFMCLVLFNFFFNSQLANNAKWKKNTTSLHMSREHFAACQKHWKNYWPSRCPLWVSVFKKVSRTQRYTAIQLGCPPKSRDNIMMIHGVTFYRMRVPHYFCLCRMTDDATWVGWLYDLNVFSLFRWGVSGAGNATAPKSANPSKGGLQPYSLVVFN